MRLLAIDLGGKRIGTAICDELGIGVRPLETIRRTNIARDIARLRALVRDFSIEAVVVGLPLRMDGTVGDAASAALKFAERIGSELGVPVYTQNETLTSVEADNLMCESGYGRRERRERSDTVAAAIILRDFLSTTNH